MASRNNTRLALGAGGAVLALLVVFGVLRNKPVSQGIGGTGDVVSPIVLGDDAQGTCVVTSKRDARVKVDKFLIWTIQNDCRDRNMQVSVGNFRIVDGPSAADNCRAATEGTADWPFQESTELSKRQHRNQIKLKVKRANNLPGSGDLEYSFDVCLGDGGERKFDPRLVIER